jgi:hypothetical protein
MACFGELRTVRFKNIGIKVSNTCFLLSQPELFERLSKTFQYFEFTSPSVQISRIFNETSRVEMSIDLYLPEYVFLSA